jgi:hypothetical protein
MRGTFCHLQLFGAIRIVVGVQTLDMCYSLAHMLLLFSLFQHIRWRRLYLHGSLNHLFFFSFFSFPCFFGIAGYYYIFFCMWQNVLQFGGLLPGYAGAAETIAGGLFRLNVSSFPLTWTKLTLPNEPTPRFVHGT